MYKEGPTVFIAVKPSTPAFAREATISFMLSTFGVSFTKIRAEESGMAFLISFT